MVLKDRDEMFTNDLRDPAYAAGYLNITLEDDGIEGFLYALQKVARAHGMSKVASSSDIPRESLYRALSDKGNPTLKTLIRVMDTLGLHLTVTASIQEPHIPTTDEPKNQVAAIHLRMEEEVAEMRRVTLEIQEEGRRVLAQMQQLTAAMTAEARQSSGAKQL